jgi:hypothetical protein
MHNFVKQSCVLFMVIMFLVNTDAFAQNTGTGPRVSVTINPETLTVGNPFTITLLVNHPVPEEVSVIAPPFVWPLTLDRFLRIPRVIAGTAAQEMPGRTSSPQNPQTFVQTSVEFRLIPNAGGNIILESFSVMTPQGTTETGQLVLNIRSEERTFASLQFSWEGAPRQITTGERVTFALRYAPQPERIPLQLPPSAFFMPEVPRGVILSQSSVSLQERENGIVLKLTLIPLTAGEFYLPVRNSLHENVRYEIPALNIRIINRTQSTTLP